MITINVTSMKFIGIGTFAIALSVSSMFVLSLKMTIGAFCSQHFASCSWQCPTASETTNVIWEMEAICWHQSLAARIAVNRDINPVPVVMGEDTRGVLSLLTSAPRRAVLTEKLSSGVLQVGPMMAEKLWQAGLKKWLWSQLSGGFPIRRDLPNNNARIH